MNLFRLGTWRVVLKRAGHDRVVVAAAFVTIVLATTLLASGPVYADAVALSGLQRTLEDAPVRDVTIAVSANLPADDYEAADERVSGAVEEAFGPGGATIHRSARSSSFSLPDLPDVPDGALTVFGSYEGLPEHASLVDGAWPAGGGGSEVDAALSEGAAGTLGLGVGDTFEVASTLDEDERVGVRVAAVYRVGDVDDPFWWRTPLEVDGRETVRFTTFGPLVVSREAFADVGADGSSFTWRVEPDIAAIGVDELSGLQERLAAMEDELAGDFTVEAALPGVLERAERSLQVSRSGVLVPSVQLAVLAGAALLFLAGLLAERRSVETAIFRSRGAGRRDVGLLALAEGTLLAVPAVLVAPWLAVVSLRAFNHVGPLADIGLELEPQVGTTSYALAAVAGVLCAAGLALPALRSAAVTTAVQEQGRPRPSGLVRRAGLDLVLVALAMLAYWQLRRYEGPVVESVRGRLGIDPLLVAAPALGLLAGALLSLRVVPAVAGWVERAAGAARGAVAPLGTRELARRPARYASAAVLLTLAVAIGLFASSYSNTWLRSQEDRAAYDAGADIRVRPDERTGSIPAVQLAGAYAGLDGVAVALPVVEQPVEISEGEPATLIAADTERLAEIVHVRPDLVGDRSLAELTAPLRERPELPTIELPGEPTAVELTAAAAAEPVEGFTVFGFNLRGTPPTVAIVLQDGKGVLHRVQAGVLPADGKTRRLVAPLAGTHGVGRPAYPLSVVAVELEIGAAPNESSQGTFTLEGISGEGMPARSETARWVVEPSTLRDAASRPQVLAVRGGTDPLLSYDFATGAAAGFAEIPVTFSARPGPAEAPETIPALATGTFLDRTGTEVGGAVALGPEQPRLRVVESVRELPTLPPEQGGALVDLRTYLATTYLQTGTVPKSGEWLVDAAAGREREVAEQLEAPPFSSTEVVDRIGVEERLTRDPVALGISGALTLGFVAAAVFAVVGFAVSAAVSTAERTTEFAVLRSLGLSERQLSGWLALEGGLTAAFALVGGLALGALVAWLVLPFVSLAGEGGRPFPDVIVELPWQTMLALSAGLVAAVLVVLGIQLVLLRRLSVGSALRAGGGT